MTCLLKQYLDYNALNKETVVQKYNTEDLTETQLQIYIQYKRQKL